MTGERDEQDRGSLFKYVTLLTMTPEKAVLTLSLFLKKLDISWSLTDEATVLASSVSFFNIICSKRSHLLVKYAAVKLPATERELKANTKYRFVSHWR